MVRGKNKMVKANLGLDRLAKDINRAHEDAMATVVKPIEKAIRCGELLVKAKAKQKHGDWLLWFESNIKFSIQTACNYIKCWKSKEKFKTVGNLADAYRLLSGKSKAHVSNNSGENEWYTPDPFLNAARGVMGGIDLDPASCNEANERVKADKFHTADDDGLQAEWSGNVWMNPPYAQPLISQFADKFTSEFQAGRIKQGCILVNNATDTEWFHTLLGNASAVCFTKGRVRFIDKDGNPSGAPLQGQAVIYCGKAVEKFVGQFRELGFVLKV